ncbi:MAG TPA: peptidase domain-containing ABC transporter [Candidatus Angelobacter sp.]
MSRDSLGCGPAALATVARHYGLFVSPEALREHLDTDLQGTSLPHLRRVAEELGFSASCGRVKTNTFDKIPLPAIAHFSDTPTGHLVVVHRISQGDVTIADPAKGLAWLPRDEFLKRWSGHVVLLSPSSRFLPNQAPEPPLVELLRIAMRERRAIGLSLVLTLFTVGLGFTISFLTEKVLDVVIPRSDLRLLYLLSAGALGVIGFRSLGVVLRQVLLAYMGYRMETSLCLPYMQHVLSLPLKFFDKRATGDIFSRTNDVSSISSAISGPLISSLPDMLFLILSAFLLFSYNVQLTLTILCFMPVLAAVVLLFLKPLVRKEREIKVQMSEWANRFIENLQSIKTLKAFVSESFAFGRTKQPYLTMQDRIRERTILSEILGTIGGFLTGGASIALLFVGARLAFQGHLTIGQMMFFFSVSGLFLGVVDRLSPSISSLQEAMIAVERLREIKCLESEENHGKQTQALPVAGKGQIEFRDVTFSYTSGNPVLSRLDLKVCAGEWLAILGETGSGKTTLANLMLGLYLPCQGDIFVEGISVGNLDHGSLRRHFAIVFQEAGLMSGTIRENLTLGSPDITLEQIQDAATLACIHDFIMGLPKRYEQNVGPLGTLLSSGQRQRIAIARALLRDAPVLILDEATSNLDMCTERSVLQNIRRRRRRQTTIVITHRLPTALLADTIIVMESGIITQKGTHDELSRAGGKYQALWDALGPVREQPLSADRAPEPWMLAEDGVAKS